MKIKKSISRRFRVTRQGKVLHATSFGAHLKVNKSKSQKRRYKKLKPVRNVIAKKIKKLLGYPTH